MAQLKSVPSLDWRLQMLCIASSPWVGAPAESTEERTRERFMDWRDGVTGWYARVFVFLCVPVYLCLCACVLIACSLGRSLAGWREKETKRARGRTERRYSFKEAAGMRRCAVPVCAFSTSDKCYTGRVQNPDIPRAGRVRAHGGAAGQGRAGMDANRIVRPGDKLPSHPPKRRRNVA